MARGVRARMVASAAELLARKGLQATSFCEVLEHSGAPRGSVYHHFPEGKDELVGSALELAGARAIELARPEGRRARRGVAAWFLHIWREVLIRAKFEAATTASRTTRTAPDGALPPVPGKTGRRPRRIGRGAGQVPAGRRAAGNRPGGRIRAIHGRGEHPDRRRARHEQGSRRGDVGGRHRRG